MKQASKCPWPYFGGKRTVAAEVWRRFGRVPGYVEPFFGSGAVLLGRPQPFDGVETVNDAYGFVCNFWRAVKAEPETVAANADRPIFENDLHAIHARLVEQKDSLQSRLEGDEEFYDAEVAGKWCWGMCCWIGSGFCSGDGPWQVQKIDGVRQLVHLSNAGRGVNRQLVHLGNAGMGVNRQLVHLGNAGMDGDGTNGIYAWMAALANRLARVRVCCGDWTRVCGGMGGDSLQYFFGGGNRCAVFLDPPYSTEANRDMRIYNVDDGDVAHAVRDWAVEHGTDKRMRIALCGYEGEHDMPADWMSFAWKARGGYSKLGGGETAGKSNRLRETIWFSPHCLRHNRQPLFEEESHADH